ncbi:MAG TPA: CDP-diacylglycerol--glycerol-3-phosphate 3-phosphatidyltransferase [Candidatus Brocadiia bacterium]|nr:CDP-diacylglycerol--glycerol-3-phosphate 3-phosphatidyltransferase [Candidatus Brocadiia bacterium]
MAKGIWNAPNAVTIGRFFATIVTFVILQYGFYLTAFVFFVLTALSDALDGYLARKYNMTSAFGRMADPITDKVLSVGGFVLLMGLSPALIKPWMVVIIVAREFIVSGIRGYCESRGIAFGADAGGKAKMVLQAISIGGAIFCLWAEHGPEWSAPFRSHGFINLIRVVVYMAVIATFSSGINYMIRGYKILREIEDA